MNADAETAEILNTLPSFRLVYADGTQAEVASVLGTKSEIKVRIKRPPDQLETPPAAALNERELAALLIVCGHHYGQTYSPDVLMDAYSRLDTVCVRVGIHPDYDRDEKQRAEVFHWHPGERPR